MVMVKMNLLLKLVQNWPRSFSKKTHFVSSLFFFQNWTWRWGCLTIISHILNLLHDKLELVFTFFYGFFFCINAYYTSFNHILYFYFPCLLIMKKQNFNRLVEMPAKSLQICRGNRLNHDLLLLITWNQT